MNNINYAHLSVLGAQSLNRSETSLRDHFSNQVTSPIRSYYKSCNENPLIQYTNGTSLIRSPRYSGLSQSLGTKY